MKFLFSGQYSTLTPNQVTKGNLRKISAHMFVSFQDFVGKNKELFCLKPGQIRQKRGIYLTQDFGFVK